MPDIFGGIARAHASGQFSGGPPPPRNLGVAEVLEGLLQGVKGLGKLTLATHVAIAVKDLATAIIESEEETGQLATAQLARLEALARGAREQEAFFAAMTLEERAAFPFVAEPERTLVLIRAGLLPAAGDTPPAPQGSLLVLDRSPDGLPLPAAQVDMPPMWRRDP